MDFSALTLGQLIERAIEEKLVAFCFIEKKRAVLHFANLRLLFSHEEARHFLRDLLHGWARSRSPVEREAKPLTEVREVGPRVVLTSSEEVIDVVLAFAKELRLIESYGKNRERGEVTLHTRATSVEMPYLDAAKFVAESMIEELGPSFRRGYTLNRVL